MSILGSCYTTLDAKLFEDAATLLPGFIGAFILQLDYFNDFVVVSHITLKVCIFPNAQIFFFRVAHIEFCVKLHAKKYPESTALYGG